MKAKRERRLSRKQILAVNFFLRDKKVTKGKALREAGYSKTVQGHPDRVFANPLVVEEMLKRGFDKDGIRFTEWRNTPPDQDVVPEENKVDIDISKLPVEFFQDLRDLLDKTPSQEPPKSADTHESKHVPTGEGIDILDGLSGEGEGIDDYSSSSSM